MKRFRWPLQRVLDVTEKRESAARAAVAEANGQIRLTDEAIAARREMLAELLDEMSRLSLTARIANQGVWMVSCPGKDPKLARLAARKDSLCRLRDRRMGELVEIRKQRKIYETLREKALDEYHRQLRKDEQKQLDESAAIGFTLRRAGHIP
jgi:flagellar biosynthesis chaperone FliJ